MYMVEVDFIRDFDLTMMKYEKLAHCPLSRALYTFAIYLPELAQIDL
jgi:hypothetical protein